MPFDKSRMALNAICPYFTMFPLEFPLDILKRRARKGETVLDPFCGRGTTNFAACLLDLRSLGVDSSPVAAAITASKVVITNADEIMEEARRILAKREAKNIPTNEFWQWAFHSTVLDSLCRFREVFMEDCSTASRIALRGIIMGALHGPKGKTFPSYFSNQCPRTYAPKPAYALRYWKRKRLNPDDVDTLTVIERRAKRYYARSSKTTGWVRLADSRFADALRTDIHFDWIITSPPYYGMQSYIPDQWLRNWFVGGPDTVDYSKKGQLIHSSPDDFVADLKQVWRNARNSCVDGAKMLIRFGGISSRSVNPLGIIEDSLRSSGWRIMSIEKAPPSSNGRRQVETFLHNKTRAMTEYDVWAGTES